MKPDRPELLVNEAGPQPSANLQLGTLRDLAAYLISTMLVCQVACETSSSSCSGIMNTGTSFTDAPDSRNLPPDPEHPLGA